MPLPVIDVDRSSPIPLYFQVAEQLERAITEGRLAPGDRIDNEITMAQQLGLSRPTMRQAIQVLVDKGLVVRKRGVGTQVVHGQIRRSIELTSLYDDLVRAGSVPETTVLSFERSTIDAGSEELVQLPDGTEVWRFERLRTVGGKPLALLYNVVPVSVADLSSASLDKSGLYQALRSAGVHLRVADQQISARGATTREARLLEERKGAPLLTMRRTAYDDEGRIVEFGSHVYRPELYSFQMTLVDR
ncbi:GntR family transcriptional regulator [Nocardioides sp. YIM 152315]|uniref:GntR family transcriptional regulator n=1 Tax=Nocardioides sp. YIM 152315 TaxID=3031760 RepID=UPI0023DAF054|nr:GntR family transcriptional regulator [Nocardioides sp. YIM 152315]MDF1605476.1 GntR family transcriptional regulator [Nocardioides sp. YIM 152315]